MQTQNDCGGLARFHDAKRKSERTGLAIPDGWLEQIMTTGILSMAIAVGTGGTPSGHLPCVTIPTAAVYATASGSKKDDILTVAVPEMLLSIRDLFSLTVTDLARLMMVERPTVYAWISGSNAPQKQSLSRLSSIYHVTERLREHLGKEGISEPRLVRSSREVALDSLMSQLDQPNMALKSLYTIFASGMPIHTTAQLRPSFREIAERHGLDTDSTASSIAFDRETKFRRG